MLHLAARTQAGWAGRAIEHMDEILLDHAHLEKKAASTALTLIFRYPDRTQLLRPLSELAREELEHFEQVLEQMDARGVPYDRLKPSPYAGKLRKIERKTEPDRLIDTLLCCSLIEARSCERMRLLSEALPDGPLRALYAGLLACEARHHMLYVDLAATVAEESVVKARLEEIAAHEAEVIRSLPTEPRLHNA